MTKHRQGFVSNSSSSSFIVKADKDDFNFDCPKCKKLIESIFEIYSAKEYITEELGYNTVEDFLSECKEDNSSILVRALKEDSNILLATVEYGGEETIRDICDALVLEYEEE